MFLSFSPIMEIKKKKSWSLLSSISAKKEGQPREVGRERENKKKIKRGRTGNRTRDHSYPKEVLYH